jgi:hypothetical protein
VAFEETPNRNINAEFNGLLLGLKHVPDNSVVNVVHDLLGLSAWVIGAWAINKPEVRDKVDLIRACVESKKLDLRFLHHAGHQNKRKGPRPICNSEFTFWNCVTDDLCNLKQSKVIMDGRDA